MSTVIISGSRSISDYELLVRAIKNSGFNLTEIVEGECSSGVDQLAKRYAHEHNIPLKPFPADWKNTAYPGAVVKLNRYNKPYDAAAGHRRNEDMAKYAASNRGACIILWDGISPGTNSMRRLALAYELPLYVSKVKVADEPLWGRQ